MPQLKLAKFFDLLNGQQLQEANLYYEVLGERLPNKEIIWICHAFTGSASVKEWWPSLFQENGGFIDLQKHIVVCANMLGSCYGSTGPLSVNPDTKEPYLEGFPELHNRDAVNAFIELRKALEIVQIDYLIGGSLGGQQVLEWSIMEPEVIKRQVIVAANARHSPWGIAFNDLQRRAIHLGKSNPEAAEEALSIARGIAMLSYRSYDDFELQQSGRGIDNQWKSVTYLKYQGSKFYNRFKTASYEVLSKMMDAHDITKGREGNDDDDILRKVKTDTLCIGITTDVLFPQKEQQYLAGKIPNATLEIIHSDKGHDAFLLEGKLISDFIVKKFKDKALV
jgi:homoserine O-acetyltransferase